jgi:aminopeptidase-like protein
MGEAIHALCGRLFPICRSITGAGVRETLRILQEVCPALQVHEVPSGTQAFDWTVPKEWNIRDAYVRDANGNKIIDFSQNNLHVVGYSTPINRKVKKKELLEHLWTEPTQPDAVPYVTSYYQERFGFCVSENQKQQIEKDYADTDEFQMLVDSSLENGSLNYGEILIPSTTGNKQEILLSTYVCHPSMANNECSGPSLAVYLAKWILNLKNRRYAYRIVFVPETIGSIVYISKNLKDLKENTVAGYVLSCVGDDRAYSCVESPYGNTLADKALKNVLARKDNAKIYSFLERGSDERQYCSPGVDLPVVGFCRSKYCEYPEYHTSADDMSLVSPRGFQGSFDCMSEVVLALEANRIYRTTVPCEPNLGKRGLYPTVSQKSAKGGMCVKNLKDFLAYADGKSDVLDISNQASANALDLAEIAATLVKNGLLQEVL